MSIFISKCLKTFSVLILLTSTFSCKKIFQKTQPIAYSEYAAFDWFEYQGKDAVFKSISKSDDEYLNPILAGFYPDPSICSANGKYYLITSSFVYFPGLPIFESVDLVNWKQIGHVIDRKEQADFSGAGVSEGLYAPTIRYNKGQFYVICTNVSGDGNFIVTATNPAGPWSDPIVIPGVNGIDPDIFFDEDGKVYITHNGPPPNNISIHNGHRAIYMFEYDLKNHTIASESKLIVNGGTDMAIKPVWIEAPHIIKKDQYYYLICAQGGTAYEHSEVVFRSKNVYGPYLSYEHNPILTQTFLDPNRKNEISTSGHADFVQLPNGDWWSVFLACRPYGMELYNTGRETFMMPVEWKEGWPTIVDGKKPLPFVNKKPNLSPSKENIAPTTGNFVSHDDFNNNQLDYIWNFIRTPLEKWYELSGGKLYIKPRKESIHTETNFSFIGRRQQHLQFEASTKLNYTLTNTLQTAGLVAFQNEKQYLLLGKRINSEGKTEVYLEETAATVNAGKSIILAKQELKDTSKDLFLKIEGKTRYYDFYYKTTEKGEWLLLAKDIDAVILSTKEAKGFVGTYIAMYASLNHFGEK
ncbi:glycoside hydrolase family 43 protein [Flavobacterium cellulosilyticum]|uniref:Glycoside hydrolase family 43 protein n=1 Tax=Flavobacterium cellulosilyticum TaxID=2541731 RepID=A0A4R5CHB9_9FLAO|nr:glycoside hydrolase family 43 protein [Flavobacterium cellulosilyticum]TDD99521.1 glycoside hydrolase family 43 protein [Flavobacterium cellulosilyticum]